MFTWHLHWTQVPPPPQAEGRNTPLLPNVVRSVEPPSTSMVCSPLMVILSLPEGESLAFTKSKRLTSIRMTVRKRRWSESAWSSCLIDFNAHEAHECDAHESGDDEGDAQTTEWCGHVRVTNLFTDRCDGYNGEPPPTPLPNPKTVASPMWILTFLHEQYAAKIEQFTAMSGRKIRRHRTKPARISRRSSTSCTMDAMTAMNMMKLRKLKSTLA